MDFSDLYIPNASLISAFPSLHLPACNSVFVFQGHVVELMGLGPQVVKTLPGVPVASPSYFCHSLGPLCAM